MKYMITKKINDPNLVPKSPLAIYAITMKRNNNK